VRVEAEGGKPVSERLLTVSEAADLLRVSVQTLYWWRKCNEGPFGFLVARRLRYPESSVQDYIKRCAEADGRGERPAV
jgi:excisionase family DNA binding protein